MASFTLPTINSRPVAILGAGVLGRRIACTWIAGGYNVNIRDPSESQRNAAVHFVDHNTEDFAKLIKDERKPGKLQVFANIERAVNNAWFVIEAVPEKLELKIETMAQLEKFAPADCIIGSNSSSYRSSLMLEKVKESTRARILNTHYSMPPINRAVEMMTCGYTDPSIFPFLTKLHEDVAQVPATAVKESTGFIINRIWAAIKRETLMVLSEGVTDAESIDKLFKHSYGSALGPCGMMDQVGLDTVAFIEDNYIKERGLSGTETVDWIRTNYIDQGKLGMKSGKGGLYPAGALLADEHSEPKDDVSAPTIYVLDIGMGSNVPNIQDATHSGKILAMSADGSKVRELITDLPLPDGLAISVSTNRMFWTNMGTNPNANNGSVMSSALDGTSITTIVAEGQVHTPKQLQLDETNQKVYFCDREGMRVHRCNYDGSAHEILICTGDYTNKTHMEDQTRWCVGITVDPDHGYIYWTQKGASKAGQGRIMRCPIDLPPNTTPEFRTDIETLFDHLPEPIDLDILPDTQTLYWTDRGEFPVGNTLNSAFVGSSSLSADADRQRKILSRHFHEAIGLKVDPVNHHVYVADLGGSVYRFDIDGSNKKVVYSSDGAFSGIDLSFVGH